MKKFIVLLLMVVMFTVSCSDDKTFNIKGKDVTVESYGWANYDDLKRDDVIYQVCVGNVVWSVITVQTIFVPIILTGWNLFEPKRLKYSEKVKIKTTRIDGKDIVID